MNKKIIPIAIASTLLVGCGSSAVNYSSEVENGRENQRRYRSDKAFSAEGRRRHRVC